MKYHKNKCDECDICYYTREQKNGKHKVPKCCGKKTRFVAGSTDPFPETKKQNENIIVLFKGNGWTGAMKGK